jgi:hydrogenase-4 membrane subunit HyfE
MHKFGRFWWDCLRDGTRGSVPFANDWQWSIGNPTFAAIAPTVIAWCAALFGPAYMSAEHPILGPFAIALGAFVITWLLAAIIGAVRAAPRRYYHEKK